MTTKKRAFSGIQPTGKVHLGNYLGAVQNWVRLQETYDCTFCIVDYHAITVDYDVAAMPARIFDLAVALLACGVDPARCTLFVQSDVPEHLELMWFLASVAPVSRLELQTQYKDKSTQHAENVNCGLLTYPVLQAADILAHRAQVVNAYLNTQQHWLRIARFPGYAPELNPIEYLWAAMKKKYLGNLGGSLTALGGALRKCKKPLSDQTLLRGFLRASCLYN